MWLSRLSGKRETLSRHTVCSPIFRRFFQYKIIKNNKPKKKKKKLQKVEKKQEKERVKYLEGDIHKRILLATRTLLRAEKEQNHPRGLSNYIYISDNVTLMQGHYTEVFPCNAYLIKIGHLARQLNLANKVGYPNGAARKKQRDLTILCLVFKTKILDKNDTCHCCFILISSYLSNYNHHHQQ